MLNTTTLVIIYFFIGVCVGVLLLEFGWYARRRRKHDKEEREIIKKHKYPDFSSAFPNPGDIWESGTERFELQEDGKWKQLPDEEK